MRFVRGLEGVLCPILVALVVAGYPTVLHAQTTSASVSGSVQDAQGGILPGVTVTGSVDLGTAGVCAASRMSGAMSVLRTVWRHR